MCAAIKVESVGRRHYLVGNTYPIKDKLRGAGAKWDAERKAWWTGKLELAVQLAGVETSSSSSEAAPASAPSREAPGDSGIVAGKATYKGKTYYMAGRIDRGRTHYDDRVSSLQSRDGSRVLLYFRDGSSQFWADRAGVNVVKSYDRPQTIGRLKRFADEAKQARKDGNDDGIPNGRSYECEECGEYVVRGDGSNCWETGAAH